MTSQQRLVAREHCPYRIEHWVSDDHHPSNQLRLKWGANKSLRLEPLICKRHLPNAKATAREEATATRQLGGGGERTELDALRRTPSSAILRSLLLADVADQGAYLPPPSHWRAWRTSVHAAAAHTAERLRLCRWLKSLPPRAEAAGGGAAAHGPGCPRFLAPDSRVGPRPRLTHRTHSPLQSSPLLTARRVWYRWSAHRRRQGSALHCRGRAADGAC
jgi:hypothetical protein